MDGSGRWRGAHRKVSGDVIVNPGTRPSTRTSTKGRVQRRFADGSPLRTPTRLHSGRPPRRRPINHTEGPSTPERPECSPWRTPAAGTCRSCTIGNLNLLASYWFGSPAVDGQSQHRFTRRVQGRYVTRANSRPPWRDGHRLELREEREDVPAARGWELQRFPPFAYLPGGAPRTDTNSGPGVRRFVSSASPSRRSRQAGPTLRNEHPEERSTRTRPRRSCYVIFQSSSCTAALLSPLPRLSSTAR